MIPNYDDTTESLELKRYLLGSVDEDRRTLLEEKILSDHQTYEQILATEAELIDEYLAGGLSPFEQEQFENHFLMTLERRRALHFGELLHSHLAANFLPSIRSTETNPSYSAGLAPATSSLWSHISRSFRALILSGAILALVCITCVWWYGGRKSAGPATQHSSEFVLVVSLAPGSGNSGEIARQSVQVPPKGYNVTLELKLTNPNFRNYKSEIFRENTSVRIADSLLKEEKGDQIFVPLTVSGDMLSPGDYQVRLSGILESGTNEFIDNYSFRVIE